MNKDVYSTFHDLATHNIRDLDYGITVLDRHSPITILAPHAGGIEPGASEIARAVAGEVFNCYLFEGLRSGSNRDLHLTSTRFDEPQGLELIRRSLLVVSIHGCEGEENEIRVGGLDITVRNRLVELLRQAGFNVHPGLGNLSGSLATNLCNMGRTGKGVQLEFTAGLRRLLFQDLDNRSGREAFTLAFSELTQVIHSGILALHNEP
jgi:phage replication-related protein YjqB (UPF0714/DUF867 family)